MNNNIGQENIILQFYSYSKNQQSQKKIQFQIIKHLGQGAEGCVILAKPLQEFYNQEQVAIKIHQGMNKETFEFYEKLFEQQQQIELKNSTEKSQIIKIYEIGTINDKFTTIMEVGDLDLYTYYRKNQQHLDLQKQQNICLKLAYAIKQFHELKYIHRDIKPENFIVVKNEFKLIDFGLVKSTDSLFNNTMMVGSRIFQAPELLIGDGNYTSAVDIWALGCTFYEILTFNQFIKANNQFEAQKIITNHITNQYQINQVIKQSKLTDQWKNLMIEMFNPNQQGRISSFQLVEKIEQIINQNNGKPSNFQLKNQVDDNNNSQGNKASFVASPNNMNFLNNNQQLQNNLQIGGQQKLQNFSQNQVNQKKNILSSTPNQANQQQNFQQNNQQNGINGDTNLQKFKTFSNQAPQQSPSQFSNLNINKQKDDKIQEQERQIQELEQENKFYKDQNQKLNDDNKIQEEKIQNLDLVNQNQQETISKLDLENKSQKEKNLLLDKDNKSQKETIEELMSNLEITIKEMENLKKKNLTLNNQNCTMRMLLKKYQDYFKSFTEESDEYFKKEQQQ